ncbi:MAG: hypothetical protein AB1847_13165 [bacterium]
MHTFEDKGKGDKRKRCRRLIFLLALLFLSISAAGGCGGGGGGGGREDSGQPDEQPYNILQIKWGQTALARIEAGGMLSPRIEAAFDGSGKVHLAYFQDGSDTPYRIRYMTADGQAPRSLSPSEPATVAGIDNCAALSLALGQDNLPVIAYRGGMIRECGREQQSDAMISLKSDTWAEYTGAIGVVERNPVFHDGLAGTEISAVVDSQGNVHLAYQFFYEGCDAMNQRYPDLCYVRKDRSALDGAVPEETVEGNQYDGDNIQNSVGYHCALTLDGEENPVIFYYAELPDHTQGLRVARKRNGVWEKEWIEEGCVVGSIACARCDAGGFLGVAYYVEEYSDGYGDGYSGGQVDSHCLRYAQEIASSWEGASSQGEGSFWRVQMVDNASFCGDYCSLAYDAEGSAAIAYYELKSHSGYDLNNLKLARFQQGVWKSEVVASEGDIGLYNTLWFDGSQRPVICSYSRTEDTIFLFSPYYEEE